MATAYKRQKSIRRPGRPTLFTPDRLKLILQSVELGCADMLCGMAAGVDYGTIREWVVRGENEGKGPFFEFAEDLKKAKGKRTNRLLGKIEVASTKHWQAAAWKLERLHPEQYGRTIQRVEHIDSQGNVISPPQGNVQNIQNNIHLTMDLSRLSDEQLQQFRSSLELISGAGQEAPGQGQGGASPALPA